MKSCYRAFSTSIQIQAVYNGFFNAIHFRWRDLPQKALYAAFVYREYLFQLNHRRLLKGCIVGYQNVRGLVFLFLGAGSHCRHNKGRRIAVSYIVLQNHHRSGAALFGADVRLHVCIVNVPSEVFPVFWYDSDQTSYPSICSKSRPFMAGGSCRKKEYADKGESINVLQEGSEKPFANRQMTRLPAWNRN